MSDPFVERLTTNRNRVLAGEEVSEEEYREIIESLRLARRTAPARKAKSAPEAPIDELF